MFGATAGRKSLYLDKLQEALQAESVVRISKGDAYMLQMFKKAAAKLKVKLVIGNDAQYLYLKPITPSEDLKRLMAISARSPHLR